MGRNTLSKAESELIKARERAFSYRNTFDNILDLVVCLNDVSELYAHEDRLAEAISTRKESIANLASLAKAKPQEYLLHHFQWSGLSQLGDLYVRLGDMKAAEHAFRDGLLKTRSVAARFPQNHDCQYDMYAALIKLAEVLDGQNDAQEAFDVYVDALAVARTYCKIKPKAKVREQNPITFTLRRIGMLCETCGELNGAREAYNEAVSLTKAESALYPDDLQCRFELAQDLNHLACTLSSLGDYELAVQKFELALTVLRATGNSSPHLTDCDELAGTILLQLAEVHSEHGNRTASRRTFRAAIAIAREIVKLSDGAYDAMKFLALCLDRAVYDMLQEESYAESAVMLRELVTLMRRLLPFEPYSEIMQHRFSGQLKNLTVCEFALGNDKAAYDATHERCDFDEELFNANPNDSLAQWRLADGLMALSHWLDEGGRQQNAVIALRLMENLQEKGRLTTDQKKLLDDLRNCFVMAAATTAHDDATTAHDDCNYQFQDASVSFDPTTHPNSKDIVMCVPYSYPAEFDDDVQGNCNWCEMPVRLRPHMPQNTQKICLPCVDTDWVNGN